MKEIPVELGDRSYTIRIGHGLLDSLGSLLPRCSRAAIVTDSNVAGLYLERARRAIEQAGVAAGAVVIPAGEEHKNRETLELVYDGLFGCGLDRGGVVVALGGGIVGDVAGFAAATFLRGVRCVQVPTTLLAAVDSSVGGKTGINHARGKNMIGAFHQPSAVVIDPATLRTLPPRELSAGIAEVVKYAVIRDAAFFDYLERHGDELLALQPDAVQEVIATCCRIKADVVRADEREAGIRAILNYGHTFGHAIEAATGYGRYRHGEAVAIGMALAARLAVRLGMLGKDAAERQEALLRRFNLPARPEGVTADDIISLARADKKARDGRARFVLPTAIGSVTVTDDVPEQLVKGLL